MIADLPLLIQGGDVLSAGQNGGGCSGVLHNDFAEETQISIVGCTVVTTPLRKVLRIVPQRPLLE